MIGHPSISRRVTGYLLVAQLLGFSLAWIIYNAAYLAGVWPHEIATLDDFAEARTRGLVLESLTRGADGLIRIAPSEELVAEMRRTPSLRFAAYDFRTGAAFPGSSPELVAALRGAGAITPEAMWFDWVQEGPHERPGVLRTQRTPFGHVRVATHGYRFRWYDIFYSLIATDMDWMPIYITIAFAASAASAWFAVRRGLAPLRVSADEARRIDLSSLNQRICGDHMPSELLPFVDAVNGALTRLDADAARLRRFTANAAHELRTPIAVLSARLDAPEEQNFKNDLKRDARRIRNIVEQLLASARMGGPSGAVDETVDLVATTQAMVTDAALVAIKNRRQIEFEAPSAQIPVHGDRSALESVIANLIDNALRAEPVGGTVQVRVRDDATVEVVDHGDGVAPNDREQIFEPFWRKNWATPGAGLGLSITKELIEKHNGSLWVEDTPGGGATFKVRLPRSGLKREGVARATTMGGSGSSTLA